MVDAELRPRFFRPHGRLSAYVQSYWLLDVPVSACGGLRYLHPDGGSGVTFSYGCGVSMNGIANGEGVTARSRQVRWTEMKLLGATRLVGVRFLPGGARPLFGTPSLSEGIEGNKRVGRVYQQVGECSSPAEICALLDSWLLTLEIDATRSPVVDAAIEAIARSDGTLRIAALAARLELTPRHLERLFRAGLDYSPKELARIARVTRAKQILPRADSIAQVGHQLNYADQAHFTREFRSMIGISPARYRKLRRARLGESAGLGLPEGQSTSV